MPDRPNPPTTRLAPSPTGALHLGNAYAFLINWALARKLGWRVVLRIEDLDTPRNKPGSDRLTLDLLRWMGIDWDDGPHYQSADLTPYRDALEQLRSQGDIYPCDATRKQIEQAMSAPHASDDERRYPGPEQIAQALREIGERPLPPPDVHAVPLLEDDTYAWRLRVPDADIPFHDALHGEQALNVQQHVGDFVVATKAGHPAYQLAVVVDDARQGVTQVVRGDDLLPSTARQVLLYQRLGLADHLPAYLHLPMVYGTDGRRLAKRHGDTRLTHYMDADTDPRRVVGLVAYWARVQGRREPMSAVELADVIRIDQLTTDPVTFTDEDEAWLQQRTP
ncbi:MAG: tRNA glutamyl-Q(34) synthetase GluQRS [Phycisphaerales bacterium JB063]